MSFKNAILRSIVIISILILSLLIGYIYQTIWHNIDLKNYPQEYAELVTEYSQKYGVPEYVIYAVIKTESNFQSNKVGENGEIGLMQLTPETFSRLLTMTKATLETGILYDPATNIEYGTYLLSYLYTEYNRWDTVFAIYNSDEATVNEWRENPKYIDDNSNLIIIPDETIKEYVETVNETIEIYKNLYYNN